MDHAVAGLHHAPPRAALSDPRRARSGGAPASRRLPHRARRVAELAGAVDERHRREVPGARRRALPRRARRATASRPASCATARATSGPSPAGPSPTDRRPPRPAAAAARRLQLGRHHQHRRRQCRSGAASSCTARCSSRSALTCRTFLAYGVDAQAPLDEIEAAIREAAAHPLHQHNDMLWLRGIKAFLDGGMLTGSAYMRQPWGVSKIYAIDDPDVSRRPVHRAREALSDRQARARERPAVHRPFAGRRGGRCDGRGLRAHQPRRLPGARPAARASPTPAS